MTTCSSYKISDRLYLNALTRAPAPRKPLPGTDHFFVIDCSGSMAGDLPAIREAVKTKLYSIMREEDTLSLLWFSGRGECGTVLSYVSAKDLRSMASIATVIDRWLRPVGMTGFVEPLTRVVDQLKATKTGRARSLFFMSDGMDNQNRRADILDTMAKLSPWLHSTTIVEYGNYADRPMLTALAERAGGVYLHCSDFSTYEPAMYATLSQRTHASQEVEFALPAPAGADHTFAFFLDEAEQTLRTYAISDATYSITIRDTDELLWYLSDTPPVTPLSHHIADLGVNARCALYAALSLYATRSKPEVVFDLLRFIGDVRFIKQFAHCFGKQAYSAFADATREAVWSLERRGVDGYDPTLVPADDTFTLLGLLRLLSNDDTARLMVDELQYRRISRGTLDVEDALTLAEREAIAELNEKISTARSKKQIDAVQTKIDAILAARPQPLRFTPDAQSEGVAIRKLVFNESSPNVSLLTEQTGSVDLSARIGSAPEPDALPTKFPTKRYRNYAIIAHGIVNVQTLPVRIGPGLLDVLKTFGVPHYRNGDTTYIDISKMPLLSRGEVKRVRLMDAASVAWELTKLRAFLKVYKTHRDDEMRPVANYSEATTRWLAEQGITVNGFAPRRVQDAVQDVIIGRQLNFKVKGYSTLPTVDSVLIKLSNGKPLNGPEQLMATAMQRVEIEALHPDTASHKARLTSLIEDTEDSIRTLSYILSQVVFTIIVGQTWFTDMPDMNSNVVTLPGSNVTVTAELRELPINV